MPGVSFYYSRVPTGPRAFFLAFTATASVDRAGREPGARVRGEAPTAALGFGPHLLWRIEPATPGEDMPRCSSGWWPHLWRALTLPARPRVAGAWRDRGPYHMRMCCRRSVSPLWTTAFYSSHCCAGDWRRIHVMDSSSHQLMNNISHLKPRRARAGTVLWSSLLRRRMGPQEDRSPWEMEAACGTAERGTFSRRRWCLNGISASPPPALVPGRIGQSATCPCANVLPFVLLATPAFDSRAISPNVNPPSTAPQPASRMPAPHRTLRFRSAGGEA